MNLRESTRDIISQVEQLTGFPVEVIEDRSLQATAVVLMASRRTVPAHIVRYNPAIGQPPNYLICFQCGSILRLFANPPEGRVECGYTTAGYEMIRKMMQAHLTGLRPNLETEDTAMKVVMPHEPPRAGRSLTCTRRTWAAASPARTSDPASCG